MKDTFLIDFFKNLNSSNIEYCILRGYEGLPEKIINDVDCGVKSKDKVAFFNVLKKNATLHKYSINVSLIRHSVIKLILTDEFNQSLKIDVWWQFNLLGLKYLNINNLLNSKHLYKNLINVPANEYEFALSFLKELLHNNWIREDKIGILKLKMNENSYYPFEKYFNKKMVDEFYCAVNNNEHILQSLARRAKLNLIVNNFKNEGIIKVFENVLIFFKIKYFYKGEYDYLIK